MTNLFFSILPNEYELAFKEEIWGCCKYIGLPYDTVMSMPIQDRKFYIMKHNEEQEKHNQTHNANNNTSTFTGDTINRFAELEQQKFGR